MRWRRSAGLRLGVVALSWLVGSASSWAAEKPGAAAAPAPSEPQAAAPAGPPRSVAAVARGFYIEGCVGGGYMAVNSTFAEDDPVYKKLTKGASEGYGAGPALQLAMGYDIANAFAIEALGGIAWVSGRRVDKVRDLGLLYGGAGLRFSLGLSERLRVRVAAGGAYARATDGVEPPQDGNAVVAGLGLEYYVHERHFSMGLQLNAVVPLKPMRAFISAAPAIKYTF